MKCPFCKAERMNKTDEENIHELRMRVDVNDAGAMYVLGSYYYHGNFGLPQDRARAMELYARAAELKFSNAHYHLGMNYHRGGDLKKAKFHLGAAAMAGHELARYFLAGREYESGNMERAVRHFTIGASGGCFRAMHSLQTLFEQGAISRDTIDSTLSAYNNACVEMRSEARDKAIRSFTNQSNCTVS
jgi:TPR repeat protein